MFKTTLKNVELVDASDLGFGENVYGLMLEAQAEELEVTVVAVASENGHGSFEGNYYDIVLENGLRIANVSGFYLVNIENFCENTHESQFCLAVQHGKTFDHEKWTAQVESMLRDALQTPHINLQYETTYAITK